MEVQVVGSDKCPHCNKYGLFYYRKDGLIFALCEECHKRTEIKVADKTVTIAIDG